MNLRSKIFVFSALLLLACADDEERGGSCPRPRACDVREAACQRHALETAACLRGSALPPDPIETVVLDATGYTTSYVGEIDPADARLTPQETAFRRALALFGASRPPTDRRSDWTAISDGSVGFYRHAERRIVLRGDELDKAAPEDAFALLVHEMTHALQGADGVLDPRPEIDNADARLAQRAMTEGEATLAAARAGVRMSGYEDGEVDWDSWFEEWQVDVAEMTSRSDDLYRDRLFLFPYFYGATFLFEALERDGLAGVRALVERTAPLTTREVLSGFADDPAAAMAPRSGRSIPVASLPAPWRPSSVSHLGAWFVASTFRRSGTFIDATGVVGDSFTVLEAPSDGPEPALAVFWRIELASGAAVSRLSSFAAFSAQGIRTTVSADGAALILTAFSGEPAEAQRAAPEWVAQTGDDLFFERASASAALDQACVR